MVAVIIMGHVTPCCGRVVSCMNKQIHLSIYININVDMVALIMGHVTPCCGRVVSCMNKQIHLSI